MDFYEGLKCYIHIDGSRDNVSGVSTSNRKIGRDSLPSYQTLRREKERRRLYFVMICVPPDYSPCNTAAHSVFAKRSSHLASQ